MEKYILTVDTNDKREVVCVLEGEGKTYVQETLDKLLKAKEVSEKKWHWRIYRLYRLEEVDAMGRPLLVTQVR